MKPIAAKKGLDLKIVEFSDYVVPNAALAAGEIEANSFQHQPYLDNQKTDRGYKIETVAHDGELPDRHLFAARTRRFDAIPNGATIAIPNDPTNGGRALILLQDKGVLKLKDGVGFKPTVADITENAKKLKFVEIDAAQAPRVLEDVDAAVINTNYATQAGLDPVKDAIAAREPEGALCQRHRRARRGQGQALGEGARRVLPDAGGQGLHREQFQGCGPAELVGASSRIARVDDRKAAIGVAHLSRAM